VNSRKIWLNSGKGEQYLENIFGKDRKREWNKTDNKQLKMSGILNNTLNIADMPVKVSNRVL
jgi:hypothetical protein